MVEVSDLRGAFQPLLAQEHFKRHLKVFTDGLFILLAYLEHALQNCGDNLVVSAKVVLAIGCRRKGLSFWTIVSTGLGFSDG